MKIKKKVLIIILSIIAGLALICGAAMLIYSIQCKNISGEERRVMEICENSSDIGSTIEYANFLKKNHNGYTYYYYYDVCSGNGTKYIVEIRDNGSDLEYSSKFRYSGPIDGLERLNDWIRYRNSEMGQLGDSIEDSINKLNGK